ncbi:acyltransferase [Cyanobium sp. Morenito 9A2]|uniref:acyltransferase family protein n=1 Tax=Cyanobium sp. Morenito 9A2 TaxID=2823718 RepID=UPI0020CD10CE|nr:acyltransferase [Cyanobium sp. Morenito 9A2]MCP9849785.1 acyltransferase [Cyanobium sp. Morenito 9A2]
MSATERTSLATSAVHAPLLDWARFLTAFLVVLCHARPDHWVGWSELNTFGHAGWAQLFFLSIRPGRQGVVIFFVLSGYLVGGRVIERVNNHTFAPGRYFSDRVSRIYTPYLPALVLTVVCVYFANGQLPRNILAQLSCNAASFQEVFCAPLEGNPSLWSLSYEVWFYALAGVLATFLSQFSMVKKTWKELALLAALGLITCWALSILNSVYLIAWLIGALVYRRPLFPASCLVNVGGGLLLVVGIVLSQLGAALSKGVNEHQGLLYVLGTLLVSAAVALLLPALARPYGRLEGSWLLDLGPRLAAFSYTLYLVHYPVFYLMRSWHAPFTAFTVESFFLFWIKILISIITAWLMYLGFERNTSHVRSLLYGKLQAGSSI